MALDEIGDDRTPDLAETLGCGPDLEQAFAVGQVRSTSTSRLPDATTPMMAVGLEPAARYWTL